MVSGITVCMGHRTMQALISGRVDLEVRNCTRMTSVSGARALE